MLGRLRPCNKPHKTQAVKESLFNIEKACTKRFLSKTFPCTSTNHSMVYCRRKVFFSKEFYKTLHLIGLSPLAL